MNRITKLALLLGFVICTSTVASANQVFKIATLAPQGSEWMNFIQAGANKISEETDGRVKFKFFAGGIQGSDSKVLRKMRTGQLHGGAFAAGSLADLTTSVLLYGLPFLFNSEEEANLIRAEFDDYVEQTLRDAGLVTFGFAGGGFAQIMSNSKVSNLQDLKGKRVWIPEGDTVSYKGMEHFGLSPVTLPITDVLTGLQTGLVDVIGASATAALVLQWHTKVSHLSSMNVSYLYGVLGISEKHFQKISPADQEIVQRNFRTVYKQMEDLSAKDDARAAEALIGSGITVVEPDPGFLLDVQARSRALWKQAASEGELPEAQLNQIYEMLAKVRGETN